MSMSLQNQQFLARKSQPALWSHPEVRMLGLEPCWEAIKLPVEGGSRGTKAPIEGLGWRMLTGVGVGDCALTHCLLALGSCLDSQCKISTVKIFFKILMFFSVIVIVSLNLDYFLLCTEYNSQKLSSPWAHTQISKWNKFLKYFRVDWLFGIWVRESRGNITYIKNWVLFSKYWPIKNKYIWS